MTLFPSVCTSAFLHDQKKLLKSHRAAVLAARRTTSQSFATWRHRHSRRARSQPSTLFNPIRRRRPRPFAADCRSLQHLSEEQIQLYRRSASPEDMVARRPSTADRRPPNPSSGYDGSDTLSNEARPIENETMTNTRSRSTRKNRHSIAVMPSCPPIDDAAEHMPPPPTPADDAVTRSSRSTSSASRNTNRLSITLPIAPPTSDPTRPISANPAYPSLPGTPARQTPSSVTSPASANELIIAIAAQERRVMELREELGRAEDDLKRVKRQWTLHEAYRKPGEQARGPAEQGVPGDDEGARRSADLDRRRMLLQQQGATRERKRVFQGRHARTLSLLSPTKPADEAFPVLEDRDVERAVPDPDPEPPAVVRRQAALNKRATWQPQRSSHTHAHSTSLSMSASPGGPYSPNNPMSQIVEDFKLGFRTFYEDIRQITVGDEPVNGGAPVRPGPGARAHTDDGDTIRPAAAPRPKLAAAFDPEPDTPSKTKTSAAASQRERNARARNKHFSWTPLSFEGIDGDAWLTFDSPASAGKSTRWSGSTMNEEEDKGVEVESPLATKATQVTSPGPGPLSPQRLEELTASVVNRLSPSSIKRTAEEYMTQWEQSMADAALEGRDGEGKEAREATGDGEGKENAPVLA